jgi:outer membrane protein OmpA-like peptidoglycan-associated protein
MRVRFTRYLPGFAPVALSVSALLLGLPGAACAGEFDIGASGGATFMDPLEVLGDGWTVIPYATYWFNPTLGGEIDLGVLGGGTQVQRPDAFQYMAYTPRVNVVGRLFPDKGVQPLLSVGLGAFAKQVDDATRSDGVACLDTGCLGLPTGTNLDLDLLADAGPGVQIPLGDPETSLFALRADVRWLLNIGSENFENHGDSFLDWETSAGILLRFGGPSDSDKDGIKDDEDKCVDQAEDVDNFQDDDGCPDSDNDNDGLNDSADLKCPNDAEDRDSFEDEDGCPDPDNDSDTVLDAQDLCPMTAGLAEFKGCPDTDKDGVEDSTDECVNDAGPAASHGCPDKDGDLVPDARDACPDQKANEGIDPDRSDGCPAKVFVTGKEIKITETVQFDTGKATIKPVSDGLLDDVVRVLQKYPGIKKIQVEGHTDDQGDDARNMKLSQDRADAVKKYLVDHGVAPERLVSKGFGETSPIADNKTADGRATNRRVAFEILEQDMSEKAKNRVLEKVEDNQAAPAPAPPAAPAPAPAPSPPKP